MWKQLLCRCNRHAVDKAVGVAVQRDHARGYPEDLAVAVDLEPVLAGIAHGAFKDEQLIVLADLAHLGILGAGAAAGAAALLKPDDAVSAHRIGAGDGDAALTLDGNGFQRDGGAVEALVAGPQHADFIAIGNLALDPPDAVAGVPCAGEHLDPLALDAVGAHSLIGGGGAAAGGELVDGQSPQLRLRRRGRRVILAVASAGAGGVAGEGRCRHAAEGNHQAKTDNEAGKKLAHDNHPFSLFYTIICRI